MADRSTPTLQSLRDKGVSRVELGLTDIDGVIRGKYVSLEKFGSLLGDGGGFCDCVFGWDVADQLYDNARYTGWHTGYPDAHFKLIADTMRWVPDASTPFFLGEFVGVDGGEHPLCPRTRLRGVLAQAAAQGMKVKLGFEYEFFVFDETPHSVRAKGYRDLKPFTPGNFGYSVLRASTHSDLFTGLMDYANALDCPLEALHCETGPGVWEGALAVTDALAASDRANLFKTFTKVFFEKRELMATFMAKWSMKYPGQSGHCHFSFWGDDDTSLFFDGNAQHRMSTRAAPRARRIATLSAGVHRNGCADDQQLHATRKGRMGADRVHMGRRKPHVGRPSDPGLVQIATHRVSCLRCRRQSVSCGVRDHRRGAAGRNRTAGTGRSRHRQCVRCGRSNRRGRVDSP